MPLCYSCYLYDFMYVAKKKHVCFESGSGKFYPALSVAAALEDW